MAGMGGILIAKLLERTEWVKNKNIRLILQPMSHAEEVRLFLCNNGFDIIEERTCRDDGRIYSVICAEYSGKIEAFPQDMSSTESSIQTMISRENSLRDSISGLKYARRLCAKRTSNSTRRSTAKRPVSVWKVFERRRKVMAVVGDIYNALDAFCPFDVHEQWDNVGLLVGESSAQVTRLPLCLI